MRSIDSKLVLRGAVTALIALALSATVGLHAYAQAPYTSALVKLEWKSKDVPRWARRYLSKFYSREINRKIDWDRLPFAVAEVSLREIVPNTPDLIVQWHDEGWCRSDGCRIDVWIFRRDYQLALRTFGQVIDVGSRYHRGLSDLLIDGARFRWTGNGYERR